MPAHHGHIALFNENVSPPRTGDLSGCTAPADVCADHGESAALPSLVFDGTLLAEALWDFIVPGNPHEAV